MKVQTLTLILLMISKVFYCQNQESYEIKWKLNQDEILIYKLNSEQIDSTNHIGFPFNLDKILADLPDSLKNNLNADDSSASEVRKWLSLFTKMGNNYDLYSILLRKPNNSIDVKMTRKKSTGSEISEIDSILQLLTNFNKGIALRGSIKEDGSIESFYLGQSQRNLLALYFELPTRPVGIGDTWPLQMSVIEFDQNFSCNKSERRNKVELVDVQEVNGEQIAYLKYDIYEMVEGNFNNPFSGKGIPTFMEISYKGISEFSITNGRWNSYKVISQMKSSGISDSNISEKIIMEPAEITLLNELLKDESDSTKGKN